MYHKVERFKKLKNSALESKQYISMIGKIEHHSSSKGRLHELRIKTQIHYQPYAGAQNYHNNVHFDEYLTKAILINFDSLTEKAFDLMKQDIEVAKEEAKSDLEDLRKELFLATSIVI